MSLAPTTVASATSATPATSPLPAEFKAKWVAALRSGHYKQGTGRLRNCSSESFCCLGVACDLLDPAGWISGDLGRWFYRLTDAAPLVAGWQSRVGTEAIYALPENLAFAEYVRDADLTINNVTASLIAHNDGGATFEQIATAIEEQL